MFKLGFRAFLAAFSLLALSLFAGLASTATAQSPAAVQANRVADNVDLNLRTQLPGHIPAWAVPQADAGVVATSAAQRLTFDVARAPQVQAAFEQLLADQQNPTSPRYHQWLTPQQIGEQFGPTQHDLDALTAWLTSQGFTIAQITPSRVFIQATAPASVVTNALQTSLHTFTVNGSALQAPLTEPRLPTALAPMVKFVAGLATVPYHTFSTLMPKLPLSALGIDAANPAGPSIRPDYTLGGGSVHYLSPADFNLIYDVAPTLNAGITGTGYRVAVIGGSRLLASDVTNWENLAALAAYQPNYVIPPGLVDPGTTNDGNQGEATLDFERVYGTAPGAQVDLVISQAALQADTDTLQLYAINTLNDPVMTMSYGACETGYASYAQHENALFAQAYAQGISVFASSGDTGVAGCEAQGTPPASQFASIEVPCDSAYVTCVGGTQFSDTLSPGTYWSTTNSTGKLSALSYIPEGGWNEPLTTNASGATVTNIDASTGGPSVTIPKPTWQTGATIPADGVRDVPDVAFSASGHNAYFSCLFYAGADCTAATGGYLTGFGGTSASAPSMAGLAVLIDQKLGKRQGLLNPILYSTAISNPAAFHDATPATSGVTACTTATPSTCNNSDASPSSLQGGIAGYPLQVGYDFPTGLGSLDFGKFIASLAPNGFTASASPASLVFGAGSTTGNQVTVTYTSIAGFTGTILQSCILTPTTVPIVPIAPSCSFNPGTVTLSGSTVTGLVLIGSSANAAPAGPQQVGALGTGATQPGKMPSGVFGGLSFAGLLLLLLPSRRRLLRNWRGLAAILFLGTTLFAVTGCGSGTAGSGGGVITGTTRGVYTLTVTATSAGQSVSTTSTVTIQ